MSTIKRGIMLMSLGLISALVLVVPSVAQQEQPEAETVTLQGVVSVVRDADGVITSVKLTTDDGTSYNVELDDKGLEMAEQAEDQKVEAQGIVTEEEGQKWLVVQSFKILET
jgi:competence protein ComGC